jgi:hypothetical protein
LRCTPCSSCRSDRSERRQPADRALRPPRAELVERLPGSALDLSRRCRLLMVVCCAPVCPPAAQDATQTTSGRSSWLFFLAFWLLAVITQWNVVIGFLIDAFDVRAAARRVPPPSPLTQEPLRSAVSASKMRRTRRPRWPVRAPRRETGSRSELAPLRRTHGPQLPAWACSSAPPTSVRAAREVHACPR